MIFCWWNKGKVEVETEAFTWIIWGGGVDFRDGWWEIGAYRKIAGGEMTYVKKHLISWLEVISRTERTQTQKNMKNPVQLV